MFTTSFVKLRYRLIFLIKVFGLFTFNWVYASDFTNFKNAEYFSQNFLTSEFAERLSERFPEENSIKSFYSMRAFKPFWYDNKTKANQLFEAVQESYHHGLPVTRYDFTLGSEEVDI